MTSEQVVQLARDAGVGWFDFSIAITAASSVESSPTSTGWPGESRAAWA